MTVAPGEILTYSGKYVTPLDLKPEQVDINDIAHALSNQCRFSGHVRHFYSVAQHSLLCVLWLENRGFSKDILRQALLHDAAEAYLQDMARPLKEDLNFGRMYRVAEQRAMEAIAEHFGLPYPFSPMVKEADIALLALERAELMPQNGRWEILDGISAPTDLKIVERSPEIAKLAFLDCFRELFDVTPTNQEGSMEEFDPTGEIDVISLDDFLAGRFDKIVPLNSPEGQKIVGGSPEVVAQGTYESFGLEEPTWSDVEEYRAMRSREIDAEIERLHVSDVAWESPFDKALREFQNSATVQQSVEDILKMEEAIRPRQVEPDGTLRHPNSARFHELLEDAGEMHDRKQADYGKGDDPFANVRASEEWGVEGWVGAMIRLNDKVKRLQSLATKGHLVNESAKDSLLDIAVYALIAYVLYEQQYESKQDAA